MEEKDSCKLLEEEVTSTTSMAMDELEQDCVEEDNSNITEVGHEKSSDVCSGEKTDHDPGIVIDDHVIINIDDTSPTIEKVHEVEDVGVNEEAEIVETLLTLLNKVTSAENETSISGTDELSNVSMENKEIEKLEKEIEEVLDDDFCGSQESVNLEIIEINPYTEVEKNRQLVREELEKMRTTEESELLKFSKLKTFIPGCRIFPDIRLAHFHTVAFRIKEFFDPREDSLQPFPSTCSEDWGPDWVPMPFCRQNERIIRGVKFTKRVEDSDGNIIEQKARTLDERIGVWNLIKRTLAQPIYSCSDLGKRINTITNSDKIYNVLQHAIEDVMTPDEGYNFFSKVLPFMVKLCLDLPKIVTCSLPLLKRYKNHSISLTQRQIGCLLANAFFCTFPPRLVNDQNYPTVNMDELFSCDPTDERISSMIHKTRCILNYFDRLANKDEGHNGVVTFTRKSHVDATCPDWKTSRKPLKQLVSLCNGTIETEGAGMLQVDFANKYIGGGVLGRGAVQEEILFVIYPELLIARLFTEKFHAGEALLVTGVERFSTYTGYSSSFTFEGDFVDCSPFDAKGRRQTQIVAIDALLIRKNLTQFNQKFMERELNKAYAGFSVPHNNSATPAVASGKWGCGAFNGNPELKGILQLLAATESGRDLVIFTFGDAKFQQTLLAMYEVIKNKTVQEVWKLLTQYYSVFCATNENDDKQPSHSLSQFFIEYVTAAEVVDMRDSESDICDGSSGERETKTTNSGPSSPCKKNDSMESKKNSGMRKRSTDEEILTSFENEISNDSDSVFLSPKKSPNKKKVSNTPALADLYTVKTPTSARICTLNPEEVLLSDDNGKKEESILKKTKQSLMTSFLIELPTNNSKKQSGRSQSLHTSISVDNEDDEPDKTQDTEESNGNGSKITKIVTDEDYLAVFSQPSHPIRLTKHATMKRKKNPDSPSLESSRSFHIRQKQECRNTDEEVTIID